MVGVDCYQRLFWPSDGSRNQSLPVPCHEDAKIVPWPPVRNSGLDDIIYEAGMERLLATYLRNCGIYHLNGVENSPDGLCQSILCPNKFSRLIVLNYA